MAEKKVSTKKEMPTRIILKKLEDNDSKWYVVHTFSGYEYKVANALQQRVHTMNMEDSINEILIPTQEKIVVSKGKKKNVKERIFPGYILVKMKMNDKAWLVVRSTEGVTGFVGVGPRPTPVPNKEVKAILQFSELEAPKFEAKFRRGDGIKITHGPFQDFVGTVSEINDEQGKVQVLVSIFGRETPVWVDFSEVEPL